MDVPDIRRYVRLSPLSDWQSWKLREHRKPSRFSEILEQNAKRLQISVRQRCEVLQKEWVRRVGEQEQAD